MKRLAFFVEGQTEQLFVEKLIYRIASEHKITIQTMKRGSGNKLIEISATGIDPQAQYYVLLVDCAQDGAVKSVIRDQYESLVKLGYEKIIGLRDVYPQVDRVELNKLRQGLAQNLPKGSSQILFLLGVMEFEAWILAEGTHYERFHSSITLQRIKHELKIDIREDDLSLRQNPAKDLHDIYWLEYIHYDKSRDFVLKILESLDFQELENNVKFKFEDLEKLYHELELFFN